MCKWQSVLLIRFLVLKSLLGGKEAWRDLLTISAFRFVLRLSQANCYATLLLLLIISLAFCSPLKCQNMNFSSGECIGVQSWVYPALDRDFYLKLFLLSAMEHSMLSKCLANKLALSDSIHLLPGSFGLNSQILSSVTLAKQLRHFKLSALIVAMTLLSLKAPEAGMEWHLKECLISVPLDLFPSRSASSPCPLSQSSSEQTELQVETQLSTPHKQNQFASSFCFLVLAIYFSSQNLCFQSVVLL